MADVESSVKTPKSLVTDVLEKAGKLEQEDFHSYVKNMLLKAEEVKAEVFKIIYEEYSFDEFQDLNSTTCQLNWKVEALINDVNTATKKIKGTVYSKLDVAATEHSQITQDLGQTEAIGQILTRLCKVHDSLNAFTLEFNSEKYCKAASIVLSVNEDLSLLPKAGQESKIYIALKDELLRLRSKLLERLNNVWRRSVSWVTPPTASLDSIHSNLKTQLTLSTESNMDTVINAMQSLNILEKNVISFGKKLVQFFFRPLLVFPSLKPSIDVKKEFVTISLSKEPSKTKTVHPEKIYGKVLEILNQIKAQFPEQAKTDDNDSPVQLFSVLGTLVWPDLSEIIIKDCLAKTIPNTQAQLEKYQEVIANTLEFEEKLKEIGFINESPSSLTNYVKDISVHFGNKKCQELLVAARDIMKDDIHNTIVIDKYCDTALLSDLGELQATVNGSKKEGNLPGKNLSEEILSQLTFQLPKCRISESTKKLVNLAYSTLLEATKSSTQSAIQLFYTVRNMFELFCNVVPTYHKDSLVTLPQLSALHHNDCMYISHLLLTMGHQFKAHLPEPLNKGAATFIDLVPIVRSLGEDCFLRQLERQKSQLLDIIKNAEGFADAQEDGRGDKIERAIKQVLHQLLHLKKIWLDVLPDKLFHQSLGALLDAVLDDITYQVLHLEDISSEEASCLHRILSVLSRRLPEIFQPKSNDTMIEGKDLIPYVPVWSKFTQTIETLEASLQEISDRWSTGDMSNVFTANEVRGIIRALFQNTDRRAEVLAKIKAI